MRYSPDMMRGWRRASVGAGLLILLLTLLIILVLYFATSGGKSYTQSVAAARKQAKATVQDINTQQITIILAAYHDTNKRLPKSLDEVEEVPAQMRKDPWGSPLEISFNTESTTGVEVIKVIYKSAGPDGTKGTPDDITKVEPLPY